MKTIINAGCIKNIRILDTQLSSLPASIKSCYFRLLLSIKQLSAL